MNDITELLENGQWTDAQKKFNELTITPQQFSEYIDTLPARLMADWALLGYYERR